MLQNAYFLAEIGADTAENEQQFAEILAIGLRVAAPCGAKRSHLLRVVLVGLLEDDDLRFAASPSAGPAWLSWCQPCKMASCFSSMVSSCLFYERELALQ